MILKYKVQTTVAYWAGILTGLLYNRYPKRIDLPSVVLCMRDFRTIRFKFGKYYNLLKNNKKTHRIIVLYETLNSQIKTTPLEVGEYSDFMQGYSKVIKKSKVKENELQKIKGILNDQNIN